MIVGNNYVNVIEYNIIVTELSRNNCFFSLSLSFSEQYYVAGDERNIFWPEEAHSHFLKPFYELLKKGNDYKDLTFDELKGKLEVQFPDSGKLMNKKSIPD